MPGSLTEDHWPPDSLRNLGVYIIAYKGSGKSRLMARLICLRDLTRGVPQIIIDGVGGLVSNLLDAVMRLPKAKRQEALSRLVYIDRSGKLTKHVCPMPLFYRFGNESSWSEVASRPLNTVISLDSHLRSAPILGANQFLAVGLPLHLIAAASGWTIVEARLLLDQPKLFKKHVQRLKAETDDWVLRDACDWFLSSFLGWDPKKRRQDTMTYRRKLDQLLRNNASIAMFGSLDNGFHRRVEQERLTVLLDYSGDQQFPELMRFKMNEDTDQTLNFLKYRVETIGPGMHLKPFGIVIDELAMLVNFDATSGSEMDPLSDKLSAILDQYGRQGMIFFTGANQERYQIPPTLFKTLMGSGIVMSGLTSDWESALSLAREWLPPQPNRIKRYDDIIHADGTVIGRRRVDMTLEEQVYRTAPLFRNLGKFEFVYREYGNPQPQWLDTTDLDPGIYPDAERVKDLKIKLSEQWGTHVDDILREINQRQQQILGGGGKSAPKRAKPKAPQEPSPQPAEFGTLSELID